MEARAEPWSSMLTHGTFRPARRAGENAHATLDRMLGNAGLASRPSWRGRSTAAGSEYEAGWQGGLCATIQSTLQFRGGRHSQERSRIGATPAALAAATVPGGPAPVEPRRCALADRRRTGFSLSSSHPSQQACNVCTVKWVRFEAAQIWRREQCVRQCPPVRYLNPNR